jgi:tetratricopeptide (TPR) repeat protein
VWDKAVAYCRQAGDKAAARSAYREAVVCFEQALVALHHLSERRETHEQAIDLRFYLCSVLFPLGEFRRILDTLREAEPFAEALGDRRRMGRVSSLMSEYFWMMGDNDRAVTSGQHALALAEALGDVALQVRTKFFLGQTYHSLGDYHRAIDVLNQNVEFLEGELIWKRIGMPFLPAVFSRTWLVFSLTDLGDFTRGIASAEEAVQIAEAADHPFSSIVAYTGFGHLSLGQGDVYEAIPLLERGLELCKVWNLQLWLPWIASSLGAAYALLGRVVEALPLLEEAVAQAAAMKLMAWHSLWVAGLSEAYLPVGRIADATPFALRALEIARTHHEPGHEAWVLRLLGKIHAHRDPPEVEPAAAAYQQALALAEALGMRPLQAHCHLGLGTLFAKTGRSEQARAELSSAIELYRAMDMTFWLPEAEHALAQVEGR